MEEGGGGVVALTPTNKSIKSVVAQLQTKCKELENGFRGALQGAAIEIGVVTGVTGICALAGASFGVLFGSLAQLQAVNNVVPLNRIFGSTRVIARNNAVLAATYGGVSCVMKRIRGKEDVKAAMVAGFCSGFMFGVVYNIPPVDAITTGLFVAVLNGLVLKEFTEPPALEGTDYTRAKSMLSNLGLQKYEKHFKKHSLTDNTMPLLKDSDLVMAGLPIGPRLLILDHIERDPDVQKMRGS